MPRRLPLPEFTAMLAMLYATVAFSIDAMLPGLPVIAAELTPDAVNRAQLVITSFVLGMGLGSGFAGPISDAIGRRATIIGGAGLYVIGTLLAYVAPSLELLLAARVLQGLGAAAPRIVGLALIRDLYQGREMARVSSFVMLVFMVVPAIAPSIGQVIIWAAGWRSIFLAYVLFACVATGWLMLRQQETLPPSARRPLSLPVLLHGAKEVLGDRTVMICTAAMTVGFGQMMALLSSIQQIYEETYHQGADFPKWFALSAVIAASASFVNARLVMRLGMHRLARGAFAVMALFSTLVALVLASNLLHGAAAFAAFYLWATSVFFMAGLVFGNLNAIAMQKMGHIAGMTASVMSAVSTVFGASIAVPVGLAFNGTPLPAITGAVICSSLGWIAMGLLREEG